MCSPMPGHVEARDWNQSFLQDFSIMVLYRAWSLPFQLDQSAWELLGNLSVSATTVLDYRHRYVLLYPAFMWALGNPNSGLHTCGAGILLTETSSPVFFVFLKTKSHVAQPGLELILFWFWVFVGWLVPLNYHTDRFIQPVVHRPHTAQHICTLWTHVTVLKDWTTLCVKS